MYVSFTHLFYSIIHLAVWIRAVCLCSSGRSQLTFEFVLRIYVHTNIVLFLCKYYVGLLLVCERCFPITGFVVRQNEMLPFFSLPLGHYLREKFRFVLTVAGHECWVFTSHSVLFANVHTNNNNNNNYRSLWAYQIIKWKINIAIDEIFRSNWLPTRYDILKWRTAHSMSKIWFLC